MQTYSSILSPETSPRPHRPRLYRSAICLGKLTHIMHLRWLNVFTLGEATCVAKRLDARYDWLPSPNTLAKYGPLLVIYVGDACSPHTFLANVTGHLALVSNDTGACSYFTKVRFCNLCATHKKFS